MNLCVQDDFMTMGYLPCRLPQSCLSMAPRFDNKLNASLIARKNPLSEYNRISESSSSTGEVDIQIYMRFLHNWEFYHSLKTILLNFSIFTPRIVYPTKDVSTDSLYKGCEFIDDCTDSLYKGCEFRDDCTDSLYKGC